MANGHATPGRRHRPRGDHPARRRRRRRPGRRCSPAGPAPARSTDWVASYELPGHLRRPAGGADPPSVLARVEARRLDPSRPVRADRRPRGLGRRRAPGGRRPSGSASSSPPASAACGRCCRPYDVLKEKGPRRIFPLTVPMLMPNGPAAAVGLELGARAGVHTPVSACASGAEAIAYALDMIRTGRADVVVAGGTEAAIHPLPHRGVRGDAGPVDPQRRPGARVAAVRHGPRRLRARRGRRRLVLETEEHARARGARSTPRSPAPGMTADAHHIAAPDPTGAGAARAMRTRASSRPERRPRTSSTSTRTRPPPPWATSPRPTRSGAPSATHADDSRLGDQVDDRAPARRRRAPSRPSSRSWRCTTASRRRRSTSTTSTPSRPRRRPRGAARAARRRHRRAQQLVRLRRPQRRPGLPERLNHGAAGGSRGRRRRRRVGIAVSPARGHSCSRPFVLDPDLHQGKRPSRKNGAPAGAPYFTRGPAAIPAIRNRIRNHPEPHPEPHERPERV